MIILDRRRMMVGGGEPPVPPLPYDAVVKYLEGDGSTYIDTGILAASNTTIKIWVQDYFGVSALEGKWLFGGRTAYNNNAFGVYVDAGAHNARLAMRNTTTALDAASTYSSSCWVELGGGTLKIGSKTKTYTNTSFTGSYNIILFGLNNGGTAIPAGVKLGEVWMTRGTTSLHLIPVRKDGVGYYWNPVTETLSTQTFTAGPDVEE